jgi:hypothetical protein
MSILAGILVSILVYLFGFACGIALTVVGTARLLGKSGIVYDTESGRFVSIYTDRRGANNVKGSE